MSSFTVTEPVPLLPSRSVAVDVFVTPAVLALTESDSGVGPLATPEPASVALQAMPTLPLFQPAALGVGATAPVTTGAALSSTYEADIGFWCCPVHPLALTFEYAVAVTVCAPLPDPAVSLNVHVDAAGPGDCRSVNPPVSSTHLVSLDVLTVNVSFPPAFAYSVPPTLTVLVPPARARELTVEPCALPATIPTTAGTSRPIVPIASRRRQFGRRCCCPR